jgi:hypothetical protein
MKSIREINWDFAVDILQIVNDYSCAADDRETFLLRCESIVKSLLIDLMPTKEDVVNQPQDDGGWFTEGAEWFRRQIIEHK